MAQYDVFELPDGQWVVDIQSDLNAIYDTRVVVPLIPPDEDAVPIRRLNPLLIVDEEERLLGTQLVSVVRRALLREPICSIAGCAGIITAAIDVLIGGV